MSSEQDKEKHSKRLYSDEIKIKKQIKYAKAFGVPIKEAHKFNKRHALNCGIPGCYLCGNRRMLFKEETVQEKSFKQRKLHNEI